MQDVGNSIRRAAVIVAGAAWILCGCDGVVSRFGAASVTTVQAMC
jgi:hypothetical protein